MLFRFLAIGDSKTAATATENWVNFLARDGSDGEQVVLESPLRIAQGGWTMGDVQAAIDAALASRTDTPDYVLLNIGVNDVANSDGSYTDQATWEGQANYVLDALHAKWPTAQIYFMRVWKRGALYQAGLNAIDDTYIPSVLSGRAYAHLGPDERVFLAAGDDGVELTSDGIHPNTAGNNAEAAQWQSLLGL